MLFRFLLFLLVISSVLSAQTIRTMGVAQQYTVLTLPAAATSANVTLWVNDSTTSTAGGTCTGGGTNYVPCKSDGSSWIVQSVGAGGPVYNAQSYGWLPDGTDHSVQALALLTAIYNAGGGTIYFPASTGVYRADSQLIFPNNGGPGSTVPKQPSIRLTGAGGGKNWWSIETCDAPAEVACTYNTPASQAVTLDLRYNGGVGGKIETEGAGVLEIDHLLLSDNAAPASYSVTGGTLTNIVVTSNSAVATFASAPGTTVGNWWHVSGSTTTALNGDYQITAISGATVTFATSGVANGTYNNAALTMSYSAPFVHTTNTQLMAHDNTFIGNGSTTQDALVLGGTSTTIGSGVTAAFQGYGSNIHDNQFTRLNRGVYLRTYANSVTVKDNAFLGNTGTRAIESDGSAGVGGNLPNSGETISGNVIEMEKYVYAIVLNATNDSQFIGNSFWDLGAQAVSFVYAFNHSETNTFLWGYTPTTSIPPITGDETAGYSLNSVNTIGGSDSTIKDVYAKGVTGAQFGNGLVVRGPYNSSNLYPGQLSIVPRTDANAVLRLGFNTTGPYSFIDSYHSGGTPNGRVLALNPGGGNVVVGGTSDTGAAPLQIAGNGVQLLGSSAPTCDAAHAGLITYSGHTTSVADATSVCQANSSNVFSYTPLGSAGSGSGTVNSGTTGQLAYYASSGSAVSGSSSLSLSNGNLGYGTSSAAKAIDLYGSLITRNLANISGNPTVAPTGATGSTSYTYKVQAYQSDGSHTDATSGVTISNGNATLDSNNYNAISWNTLTDAVSYKVYRTASGGTPSSTGFLATVIAPIHAYNDQGAAGDSTTPPNVNTSGSVIVSGGMAINNVLSSGVALAIGTPVFGSAQGLSIKAGTGVSIPLNVTDSAQSINLFTIVSGIGNGSQSVTRINPDTTRIGLSNTSSGITATLHVLDNTASTGKTREILQAGAGQSTINLLEFQNNTGTVLSSVSPNGTYLVAGLQTGLRSVTANDTATTDDYTILCNATSGAVTETLPASPKAGEIHVIKKTDSSASACSVSGNGVNIDGASTYALSAQYKYVTVQYGSSQWWVIANN